MSALQYCRLDAEPYPLAGAMKQPRTGRHGRRTPSRGGQHQQALAFRDARWNRWTMGPAGTRSRRRSAAVGAGQVSAWRLRTWRGGACRCARPGPSPRCIGGAVWHHLKQSGALQQGNGLTLGAPLLSRGANGLTQPPYPHCQEGGGGPTRRVQLCGSHGAHHASRTGWNEHGNTTADQVRDPAMSRARARGSYRKRPRGRTLMQVQARRASKASDADPTEGQAR